MKKLLFALPGNEILAESLINLTDAEKGELQLNHFPDGESYVRILSEVKNREIILVCTLHFPDSKLLPLYFLTKELRNCGVAKITLVAPYLSYLRQDKVFKTGEVVTSRYFAELISGIADELITIDPHLHRWKSLNEIYSIPCQILHASGHISAYIQKHIINPILIGPDSESKQWVSEVAAMASAPFIVLEKTRLSDKEVKVSVPQLEEFKDRSPVLIDDIISTAHTMIEAVNHLKNSGAKPVTCIGVHAIFSDNAYEELLQTGAEIITCNTIIHSTNKIELSTLLAKALK